MTSISASGIYVFNDLWDELYLQRTHTMVVYLIFDSSAVIISSLNLNIFKGRGDLEWKQNVSLGRIVSPFVTKNSNSAHLGVVLLRSKFLQMVY